MSNTTFYQPTNKSAILTTVALASMTALYLLISSAVLRHETASAAATSPGLSGEVHSANIPYFVESEDLQSTLILNNNKPTETTALVTVYNAKGEALQLPPINLKPLAPSLFRLQDLLKGARGDFGAGNIRILHDGTSMAVTSQVSIVSTDRRLSFESIEAMAEDFPTTRLDGILWVPDEETQAKVALTNASSSTIDIAIKTDKEQSNLSLLPRETRVVDLRALIMNVVEESGGVLVTMEHNGTPGALITTGFALNKKSGFSSNLNFADCEASRSTKLAGAHVRLGSADPGEGFQRGTRFRAPLAIANTMHDPTQARISLDYTVGGRLQRLQLNPVSLAPREVKLIDLSKQMMRKGITSELEDAGVDISYDGMPGTVIGRLTSYDNGGDFSFDVPIKDPIGKGNGSYPWRIDKDYHTVVHLKNTLDKSVTAIIQVRYDGGSYSPDRIKLAAYQTLAIDLQQLRDAQKKDVRGGVMPKDVTSGQLAWFEEEPQSMIGRAECASIKDGIASSFSCGSCCNSHYYDHSIMTPTSYDMAVGDSEEFAPGVMMRDCNYVPYGPYSPSSAVSWSSTNTSVATVDSYGNVTGVAEGTSSIVAQWTEVVGYAYMCNPIYSTVGSSGTCQITPRPSKLVRFDYTVTNPGAPDGYGPLVLAANTNNEVRDVSNHATLTNRCGAYRNLVYELQDQNGMSITQAYNITENFSNYAHSTTFSQGTIPPTDSKNITAGNIVNDTMFLGKILPNCLGADDNESFDQSFVVTLNGKPYPLTTVNHISRGRFAGTYKVDVTITTP